MKGYNVRAQNSSPMHKDQCGECGKQCSLPDNISRYAITTA